MKLDNLRRTFANRGAPGIAIDLAHSAVNRCTHVCLVDALVVEAASLPPRDALPGGEREVVLDQADLLRYAENPANDLTADFIRAASARGDRCYAAVAGETLASYVWCSSIPTALTSRLLVTFDTRFTYSYKAFTAPAYRGRRLHGRLTAMLLAAEGHDLQGTIACVDVNNFSSAKSSYRMGANRAGTLSAVLAFGRYWVARTAGCEAYGLTLTDSAA